MIELATLQFASAGLMAFAIAVIVARRPRSLLGWTWVAFLISAAAGLTLRAVGPDAGPWLFLILAPASATCGVSWLLARALFREEPQFSPAHIGVVAVIAAVNLAPAGLFAEMLGNLQNLLASTVIVLTLWEAIRGWSRQSARSERIMRAAYFSVTAAAVLIAVIWLRNPVEPVWLDGLVETLALLAVTLAGALCVHYRLRNPLTANSNGPAQPARVEARPVSAEIKQLADQMDRMVRAESLFLDGDLKVADLARRLQMPDYKTTRAITGALGAANFNAYINRFRIDHARKLLAEDPGRSILAVAFDSGFASIGPFNRAFKAMTGQTPRDYRAHLETAAFAKPA